MTQSTWHPFQVVNPDDSSEMGFLYFSNTYGNLRIKYELDEDWESPVPLVQYAGVHDGKKLWTLCYSNGFCIAMQGFTLPAVRKETYIFIGADCEAFQRFAALTNTVFINERRQLISALPLQ